ncbi:GtrA family protein [Streptomyces sp. NBC_00046]|uniref:GtrA family protein n=1 Tax=unclassified Streptomyces TaxID=2593676 RepID=UPI0032533F82
MTAPTRRQTRAVRPLVAAFARFVVCGGGVGLVSSAAVVLLSARIPMAVANALVTVASTVVATELHRRISFRSERKGWGVHLRSGATVAVSYAFTTGALLCLFAVQPHPSPLAAQTVYLAASALAGVGRFALLRVIVFGNRSRSGHGRASRADALRKSSVAMAV